MTTIEQLTIITVLLLIIGIQMGSRHAPDGTRFARVHRIEDVISVIIIAVIVILAFNGYFHK